MKVDTIQIKHCAWCRHRDNGVMYCNLKKRYIDHEEVDGGKCFPKWCPLEEYVI